MGPYYVDGQRGMTRAEDIPPVGKGLGTIKRPGINFQTFQAGGRPGSSRAGARKRRTAVHCGQQQGLAGSDNVGATHHHRLPVAPSLRHYCVSSNSVQARTPLRDSDPASYTAIFFSATTKPQPSRDQSGVSTNKVVDVFMFISPVLLCC